MTDITDDYIVQFRRPNGGKQQDLPSDGRPIGICISAGQPYHKYKYLKPVVERIAASAPTSPLVLLVFDQIQSRSLEIKGKAEGSFANELGNHLGAKFLKEDWGKIDETIRERTKILRFIDMRKLPAYAPVKAILDGEYQNHNSTAYRETSAVAKKYLQRSGAYVRKDHDQSTILSTDFQLSECAGEAAVVDAHPGMLITYIGKQHNLLRAMSRDQIPGMPANFIGRPFLTVEINELVDGKLVPLRFESPGLPDLEPTPEPARPDMIEADQPAEFKELLSRLG